MLSTEHKLRIYYICTKIYY